MADTQSLLAEPKHSWLRANARGMVGVDRANKAVMGYVVAQEGKFLEPNPRGEFDERSLRSIVALMAKNKNGTKSRLGHPTLSNDGISAFLGRAKNPRLDKVVIDGQELLAVRADLYLADSAFEGNPNGNIGEYVLQRAEEDPNSFATSLVLQSDEEWRLDTHKRKRTDENGQELPPLWRPLSIHASDVVDSAAACHNFLSADQLASLPDALVRQGCELLDAQFSGKDRAFVSAHLSAFTERYLNHKFGEPEETESAPVEDSQPADEATALLLQIALEE
jgi:hypothetical protein